MKKVNRLFKNIVTYLGNFLKVRSIQFIITVSFACITILAMFFVGIIIYGRFTKTAEQSVGNSTMQVIEQVSENLNDYYKGLTDITVLIENSIQRVPNLPDRRLEEQLDVILSLRGDIVNAALFTDNGVLAAGDPFSQLKPTANVIRQQWFTAALQNPGIPLLSTPHVQNLFSGINRWVLTLSKTVQFMYAGKITNGVLLIDINFSTINQLCGKGAHGKQGYAYVIDAKGNLIFHPQLQLIYAGLKQETMNEVVLKSSYGNIFQGTGSDRRLLSVKNIGYTNWRVIGVSYMEELLSTKRAFTNFSLGILTLGFLFVILLFIFISAKITQPIRKLKNSMRKVEEGNFDTYVDIAGDEEVIQLSKTFNTMVRKIRHLMDQILKEQEAKRKSELNALQAQINPHFLYNTLDSIVWMAEAEKHEEVITMVTALARLFRISISRGKNIITVKQELEHARNYLIIQSIRYKNKFQYVIDPEDEVLYCKSLKLILQPIIENAIYHGIEYMVDEGMIHISARIADDKLMYEVRDNGLGMKQEIVEKLLRSFHEENSDFGVGVRNVNERIQLSFGKEYGLQIESELEVGTTVRLILPLLKDEI